MDTLERFKELYALLRVEFLRVVEKSEYSGKGPVIFFDLREKSLEALEISNPGEKIKDLREMVEIYICTYEQMNSFILCDNAEDCRFYSLNQICRLLTGRYCPAKFSWCAVFPTGEIEAFIPENMHKNFPFAEWYHAYGNGFACLYLYEIPEVYFKYGEAVTGVENYLPEIVYFIMEGIKNGYYPHVIYPPLYKTDKHLPNMHPKVVYWHQSTGSVNWKDENLRYIPPTPVR